MEAKQVISAVPHYICDAWSLIGVGGQTVDGQGNYVFLKVVNVMLLKQLLAKHLPYINLQIAYHVLHN